MRARRSIAIALVLLQIATLTVVTATYVVPAILGLALVFAAMPRVRLPLSERRAMVVYASLALLFFVETRFWPLPARTFSPLMSSTSARGIAHFFVAVQIVQFMLHKTSFPRYFPLLSMVALAFVGSIADRGRVYFGFGGGAILASVLLLLYFMSSDMPASKDHGFAGRRYYAFRVLAMVCVVTVGLGVAHLLTRYQQDLDLLFTRFVTLGTVPSSVGLSDMSQLTSVSEFRSHKENAIALRVVSDGAPGHLRSRVYSMYRGNRWGVGVNRWLCDPEPGHGDERGRTHGMHLFTVRQSDVTDADQLEAWPADSIAGRLLAPLDVAAYRVRVEQIGIDDNGAADAPDFVPGDPYVAYMAKRVALRPAHDATVNAALDIPNTLGPAVRDLARGLFEKAETTEDKMTAVLEYFSKYQYRIGITIPNGEDPLTYFLLQRPPAHCEYFASGAAVLLRLGGVPARYVTGFVPTEYNPFADCWVARNKDAHAWVEAYDANRGWLTLDPTPGAGQPQARGHTSIALAWEALRFRVAEFVALLRTDVGAAIKRLMLGMVRLTLVVLLSTGLGWGMIALLFLLAGMAAVRYVRRLRRPVPRPSQHPMAAGLRKMERLLWRRRVVRGVAETLHQFAARLEREHHGEPWAREAALWYRSYADRRYGRSTGIPGGNALNH